MIDTLNMWMDGADIEGAKPFDILPYLSDVTEKNNNARGLHYSGKCGSYSVNVYSYGIMFVGSLVKYYYGDNLHTLTHKTTIEALKMLSDTLHIQMDEANIIRLDLSATMPMKKPVFCYYPYLGEKTRFQRNEVCTNTLYYTTNQKRLAFYDKTKEALKSGVIIPEILQNANLLRYELRYTNRCKSQLGKEAVKVKNLYNKGFYISLVKNWLNEFKSIKKNNKTTIDMECIKTPKDAINVCICQALQEYGQKNIDDFLSLLKSQKVFTDRQNLYKVKKELAKMMQSQTIIKDDMLLELENNIKDVAMFQM